MKYYLSIALSSIQKGKLTYQNKILPKKLLNTPGSPQARSRDLQEFGRGESIPSSPQARSRDLVDVEAKLMEELILS